MTENEWLACQDPWLMIDSLPKDFSPRKLRLFCCACCRRIWYLLDDSCRKAVELSEAYADGLASEAEVVEACNAANESAMGIARAHAKAIQRLEDELRTSGSSSDAAYRTFAKTAPKTYNFAAARAAAYTAALGPAMVIDQVSDAASGYSAIPWDDYRDNEGYDANRAAIVPVLREIVDNPFRPINIQGSFLTLEVMSLANEIYQRQAFEQMPELADALAEVGCSKQDILSHCRGPGAHVRGCWVVDLVLGE